MEMSKVVIVGGGIAGALLAKNLQFTTDVTLIDRKEYFEIPWANLRGRVEPSFAERSVISHTEYLTCGRLITSPAVNITATEVETALGRSVPYDYLVIATGHVDATPRSRRDRLEQFLEDNQKIKTSSSVLIVGGGPTGVELAGEIATDFPEKKVTLVHSGSRLLEFIGPKASSKTLEWLQFRNVEVLMNQSINLNSVTDSDREFTTSAGETVKADCHFACVGRPLGSSWLKGSILKDSLDRNGRLMVDDFLRVMGQKNIFAIGDITNIPEIKQGYLAQRHAMLVAKNLKAVMRRGKECSLTPYKPASIMALVSLGRRDAVAQFPLTTFIGLLPGMVKSRDLFVGKTRRQMGLHPK